MALNHTGTVELETNRLKLRRFVPEDAEMMFANWAGDPVVTEYLSWDPHASPDATKSLLDIWCAQYENPDYYNWAIEYEGEIVGNISVTRIRERNERAEIGYCLAHHHWGKGIMPEAFSAVIDYLFGTVGFHAIEAEHDAHNPKSGRVMAKCGMTRDGVRREAWHHRDGTWHDLEVYSILRSEWRQSWLKRCKA